MQSSNNFGDWFKRRLAILTLFDATESRHNSVCEQDFGDSEKKVVYSM